MTAPIFEGFSKQDDAKVAKELQYYLNCNTCTELVRQLRNSPSDKILVELLATGVENVCLDFVDKESCSQLKAEN